MKYYSHLPEQTQEDLFAQRPKGFTLSSGRDVLATALGATLYCPATRPNLVGDVAKMFHKGARSLILCLEDSVPDERLTEAERNLHEFLLTSPAPEEPLLFIRIRTPAHLQHIVENNREGLHTGRIAGFVFPKFDATPEQWVQTFSSLRAEDPQLPEFFMPVMESPAVVRRFTRDAVLRASWEALQAVKPSVLAVRIGATDMSSVYGIRRSPDVTIYDVHVIASAISDIVNVFGEDFVVTGPVWEYFEYAVRIFKPLLRESLFVGADEAVTEELKAMRRKLLTGGDDSFIREVQLDRTAGILGKTIIHPSHIAIVNALNAVPFEMFSDAQQIVSNSAVGGGAYASFKKNKMNEVKPHMNWAQKTLRQAAIFGVLQDGKDFVDVLEEEYKNEHK